MKETLQNVKQSFQEMLDQNEWMDERTKVEAFKKLDSLKILVAYMESIFNETKLKKHFSEVNGSKPQFIVFCSMKSALVNPSPKSWPQWRS